MPAVIPFSKVKIWTSAAGAVIDFFSLVLVISVALRLLLDCVVDKALSYPLAAIITSEPIERLLISVTNV